MGACGQRAKSANLHLHRIRTQKAEAELCSHLSCEAPQPEQSATNTFKGPGYHYDYECRGESQMDNGHIQGCHFIRDCAR